VAVTGPHTRAGYICAARFLLLSALNHLSITYMGIIRTNPAVKWSEPIERWWKWSEPIGKWSEPIEGCLIAALVSEPKVLLADEPASGLSAAQRTVLAEALTTISEDRAVVVVEHDLDMLTSISEHMWAMVEGRLAYSGDVETFRASPVYAGLRGIEQA